MSVELFCGMASTGNTTALLQYGRFTTTVAMICVPLATALLLSLRHTTKPFWFLMFVRSGGFLPYCRAERSAESRERASFDDKPYFCLLSFHVIYHR